MNGKWRADRIRALVKLIKAELQVSPNIQMKCHEFYDYALADHKLLTVAVSGDTVVVGAYFEDSNATTINGNGSNNSANIAGAAYVFVRSGSSWSQQAYLKANNSQAGDKFGTSVAVAGDTVVVGAPNEFSNATTVNGNGSDNNASGAGAAYVFVRSGSSCSQQA